VVPVDVICTPRLNSAGKRVGYVFVGRPMGELKRAYRELSETHEALKRTQQQLLHSEKMASLGRLVAGVAHELNNPISFVLGNVHALKRYSERLAQYVTALHEGGDAAALRGKLRIDHILRDLPSLIEGTLEGAERTTEIVNGLKRFSAVDREERVAVDLNSVVRRAIHWISKGAAPSFAVHWTPGAALQVLGSAGQLLQVLMNLIQNACDAASGAGVEQPQLWIEAQSGAGMISLTLRDNGPGIAPADLSRIFDPFFTTKAVGKGTGLGLSISYGIIEQHGGRLYARNHPAGGAEFVIELPRLENQESHRRGAEGAE
jgi:two-component system sensor histidine kinase HupT/HoxJ